jgi:ATP-dependent exoDNAse (exonuclease V) beta subunit
LKRRLNSLYAEPASSSIADGRLPVELLTIHKAKGLEWDVVLVPGMGRGGGQSQSVLLNWLEFDGASDGGISASVVLAPIGQKGADKDRLGRWLTGIRAKREAAENKRVFYVAATRAREELHLFGAAKLNVHGEFLPPRVNTLLRACWPAAQRHFEEFLQRQTASRDQHRIDPLREDYEELSLAAEAETSGNESSGETFPIIERLPLSFDPGTRFLQATKTRLLYPAPLALRQTIAFDRPEGSFGVRAFGNVVHRYLQLLATKLEGDTTCDALLAQLPSWHSRIMASLRAEGISPALVAREAARAQEALTRTLGDALGRWILLPRAMAVSERALTLAATNAPGLRVDRMFLAGAQPLLPGESHTWIVDFKTTLQGSRSDEEFEAAEIGKYRAQLETYAALRRSLPGGDRPIELGLYYPMVPRLLHWTSEASPLSETQLPATS